MRLIKSTSPAYAISGGRSLCSGVVRTSRSAFSKYMMNSTGLRPSPWGVPVLARQE